MATGTQFQIHKYTNAALFQFLDDSDQFAVIQKKLQATKTKTMRPHIYTITNQRTGHPYVNPGTSRKRWRDKLSSLIFRLTSVSVYTNPSVSSVATCSLSSRSMFSPSVQPAPRPTSFATSSPGPLSCVASEERARGSGPIRIPCDLPNVRDSILSGRSSFPDGQPTSSPNRRGGCKAYYGPACMSN